MSLKDEMLAGETIAYTTTKHWFAPLRDSLIPILLLIGAYLVSVISPNPDGILSFVGTLFDWLRLGLLVVGIGWILYNIVVWRTAVFAVTNRRVVREEGLLSRRSSATILSTVTDVQSRVPMLGGPLGFGDLVIFTQSGGAGADRFKTITDPKTFRDKMLNTKIATETPAPAPSPVPAAAPAPAAPAAAPTPTSDEQLQTLARLAELRDSGAITPEEFEAKKTDLLSRI
jgi:hypothetical protein